MTAPSIQTLSLTRQKKQQLSETSISPPGSEALVVGNPVMPKLRVGKDLQPLKSLAGAEQEAKQN